MASVSETELEQKTSEYIGYVRELFTSLGKKTYRSPTTAIQIDGDSLILEYEGK